MKKRSLILIALVMALVLCLSFGVCAHEYGYVTSTGTDDPNQYTVDSVISDGYSNGNLWIGTLSAWEGALGSTGTFFDNGEAIHPDDIIITNGKVGIALSVGTRNPWGYPSGSVLDAGTVTGDSIANYVGNRDNTWSIEPLVNGWDSWAPDNCGVVSFELVNYDFGAKAEAATGLDAVKVSRIFAIGDRSFTVITYYGIEDGAEYAYMYSYYKNTGDKTKTSVRFSVTNKGDDGGAMFSMKPNAAVGSYTQANGQEYSVGLMMPGIVETSVGKVTVGKWGGSVGYKELRIDGVEEDGTNDGDGKYAWTAGEEVTFPCAIVISDTADFEKVNTYFLDYMGIVDRTTVTGTTLPGGTVIVKENGKDYGWFKADDEGNFTFQVPQNNGKEYTYYLESNGYCDSEKGTVNNFGKTYNAGTLVPGEAKKTVTIKVTDQNGTPIPAKVEVYEPDGEGGWITSYPAVRFNGNSIYYDSSNEVGTVEIEVEPGDFKAVVFGQGYWFTSVADDIIGNTDTLEYSMEIEEQFTKPEGWYCGDMHHHANKNDAFSAPSDVVKSIAASGLDVYLTTDHDFTTNNIKAFNLAGKYSLLGYIPSEEISCSWAHFNVIPQTLEGYQYFLDEAEENHTMNQFGHLDFFVNQTHEHQATITANHPWDTYGLFSADAKNAIPGGYVDDYDNVEINADLVQDMNTAAIVSVAGLWTSYMDETQIYKDIAGEGVYTDKAHYLLGGSDTHDVRFYGFAKDDYSNSRGDGKYCSGKVRTFAYVEDMQAQADDSQVITENGLAFAHAVAAGNSYVSYGPILNLDKVPGNGSAEYIAAGDAFEVNFSYCCVNEIDNIFVLTKNGTEDLIAGDFGPINYVDELDVEKESECIKYDKEATEAARATAKYDAATNSWTAKVSVDVTAPVDNNWVSIIVLDKKGNYAITNPYWIIAMPNDLDQNRWYYPYMQTARIFDIVNGHTEGDFAPSDNVTRAEFCKICYEALNNHRALNVLASNYTMPERKAGPASFPDVEKGKWYTEAVTWMSSKGYINGYDNGKFGTNDPITRAQICKILDNIIGEPTVTEPQKVKFNDIAGTEWYAKAVLNLASYKVVNGIGDNLFAPNNQATRAEAIKMIMALITPDPQKWMNENL